MQTLPHCTAASRGYRSSALRSDAVQKSSATMESPAEEGGGPTASPDEPASPAGTKEEVAAQGDPTELASSARHTGAPSRQWWCVLRGGLRWLVRGGWRCVVGVGGAWCVV